jgi:hypothetical protein
MDAPMKGTGPLVMVTRATLGSTEFTGIPSSGEQRPSDDMTAEATFAMPEPENHLCGVGACAGVGRHFLFERRRSGRV